MDFVEDEGASDTADTIVREIETTTLWKEIEALREHACYVLVRRHGLDGHPPATLRGLADELGFSRS